MRTRMVVAAVTVALAAGVAAAASRSETYRTGRELAPGQALVVDTAAFDVRVSVGGARVEAVVRARASAPAARLGELLESARPRWVEDGDRLVLRVRPRTRGWSLFGGERVRGSVEVRVPPGIRLVVDTASGDVSVTGDLGEGRLEVDTASGDVEVRGGAKEVVVDTASGEVLLAAGREIPAVSVDTASGDVTVRGPVGTLRVDTASGDVLIRERVGALTVDAASGDVVASALEGSAGVATASGDVRLTWTRVPRRAEVRVDTASGEVVVSLPSGTSPAGTVATSSGEIESFFPGRASRRGRRFVLAGDGPPEVRIRTVSGDVTLSRS